MFHCVGTTAFLSIHLLMASRLLPCPGYYKQCCDEHWGTAVSFNSGFLSVYSQQQDYWVIWQFYLQCFFFFFSFFFLFFPFIFISWRLIRLQYCSGFCHTLTWIIRVFTCIPHPDPPSHLPLHPIISTLFSIVAVLVCIPTNSVRGFPFLHTLSSIYCL